MTKKLLSSPQIVACLGSHRFFWGIVVFFVLQAAWIALSARYPMAFDEEYHLGLIRLYADHLSPFWTAQPPGADIYGAVVRDPSYLFHYLMSFPYHFISAITSSLMIQVMFLRALNIALFAGGLVVFRQLLLRAGASPAMAHVCLLLFILIPVAPFLAAHINYDNALILLTGLLLLLAVNFVQGLKQRHINLQLLLGVFATGMVMTLVKYAALPIFAAVVLYLLVMWWRNRQAAQWQRIKGRAGTVLVLVTLVSGGLFAERYGVNLVRYHTPVPDCGQVLSTEQCLNYSPWRRNHNMSLRKAADTEYSPLYFNGEWFHGMWVRLFFTLDGAAGHYQTGRPMPVPSVSAIGFAAVSAGLFVVYAWRIFKRYDKRVLGLLAAAALSYVVILWLNGYKDHLYTGYYVAINGRYLLPVMPVLLLFGALAWREFFRKKPQLKLLVAAIAVTCMLWGGGALTFILRSQDSWYWPYPAVRPVNHVVQQALGPLTPGYDRPKQFLR